ncbi:MAG: hypothetical protein ABIZ34_10285 [Candidatus Limnocylindrales bacterium]
MTAEAKLERSLTEFFSWEGSRHAPTDLHTTAMARVARVRQRPPVLARLQGERLGRSIRATRLARIVVLTGAALILLVMAMLFAAGAPRSAASGTITYVSYDSSTSDASLPPPSSIWSVGGDGTGDHRIGFGECPTVSADGATVVFVSGRLGNQKGQMIAANGDGSEQHVLPDVAAWIGAISPDGSQVAWAKDVGSEDELWVSPVSGSPGVRIVRTAATPNVTYDGQVWSPAGDQIAFVESVIEASGRAVDTSIWLVKADGSELHQLVTASPGTSISWSPDGRWLTYVQDSETGPQLVALAADGSVEGLVGAATAPGRSWWSPDGKYLAFLDLDGIATVEMSDGSPVGAPHRGPTATGSTFRFDLAWSPDSHDLLIVETRRISPGTRAENFASRLLLSDPQFQDEPSLLLDREQSIGDFYQCPVTWSNP